MSSWWLHEHVSVSELASHAVKISVLYCPEVIPQKSGEQKRSQTQWWGGWVPRSLRASICPLGDTRPGAETGRPGPPLAVGAADEPQENAACSLGSNGAEGAGGGGGGGLGLAGDGPCFPRCGLMATARHTEAVFPSSSLSCKVIMNISFMFSHIRYSYAQAPDEMPQLGSSSFLGRGEGGVPP